MKPLVVAGAVAATLVSLPVALVYFSPRWLKRWFLLRTLLVRRSPPPKPRPTYEESVLPHGELRALADNLWVVTGSVPQPGPPFGRNCAVWRRPSDGALLVYSPVCLRPEVRAALEALGEVRWIVVPNPYHRLDAHAWSVAYPSAEVLAPYAAVDDTEAHGYVAVTASLEERAQAIGVTLLPAAGTWKLEVPLLLPLQGGGEALVVADLFFNLEPSETDALTRFVGAADGFGPTGIGRILADDPGALRAWVETELTTRDLRVVVVGHGAAVVGQEAVREKLAEAAARCF
mmetsp:Transcript_8510/g.28972  ORF Transcript_8510/g.28972 Transcript_8510/m.28972 type:complete len:289 (+) Transcript_8510:108-974(+)